MGNKPSQPATNLGEYRPSTATLETITFLSIIDKRPTLVHNVLKKASELKELHVRACHLTHLPTTAYRMTKMTWLDLSNNRLTSFPADMQRMTALRILDLSRNGIQHFPAFVTSFRHLCSLDVSFNKLSEVPVQLKVMTSITKLSLRGNEISQYPTWIMHLSDSTWWIDVKELCSLPMDFIPAHLPLSAATKLWIKEHRLQSLPNCISQLLYLVDLNLKSNELYELPSGMSTLSCLEALNISSNKFKEIPPVVSQLIRLNHFVINDNPDLSSLPPWITKVGGLGWEPWHFDLLNLSMSYQPFGSRFNQSTSMKIYETKLSHIPPAISLMTSLYELEIISNEMTGLSNEISRLQKLTNICLICPKMTALPDTISHLTKMKRIQIADTDIRSLPVWFSTLQKLSWGHDSVELMRSPIHISPWKTETIGITSISVIKFELHTVPESISTVINLASLQISDNKLSNLPTSLSLLKKLSNLDISDNPISVLPDFIGGLTCLKKLNITRNNITELPATITKLKLLEKLIIKSGSWYSAHSENDRENQASTTIFAPVGITTLPCWSQSYYDCGYLLSMPLYDDEE